MYLYILEEKANKAKEGQQKISKALSLIKQIKSRVNLEKASVKNALKFKDEVQKTFNDLQQFQKEYGNITIKYEKLYRAQQNICLKTNR